MAWSHDLDEVFGTHKESSLTNLTIPAGGGSLGLFQQRPSQGWGTPAQLTRPAYASRAFYHHVVRVPRWQEIPLTVAAQAVQHSGHPGAYAQWQPLAQSLVTTFDGAGAACGAAPAASGLGAAILSYAQSQLGIPYQYGGGSDTGPSPGFNSNGSGQPGWDCSGLVMYAIYQASRGKIGLPHNADLQYRSPDVQLIAYSQLQPGDLVFLPGSDGTMFSGGSGCEIRINPSVCPAHMLKSGPSTNTAGVVDAGPSPWQKCVAAMVILYAASELGKPYARGATGPDAFDCSGLAMMAYRAGGVGIPRTSEEQWAAGPSVPPGQEEPGDLVFFAGSDGTAQEPGHVGVVLGGGLMLDAPYTGADVRVDEIAGAVGFTRPAAAG